MDRSNAVRYLFLAAYRDTEADFKPVLFSFMNQFCAVERHKLLSYIATGIDVGVHFIHPNLHL